jgi:hypothetical protein
MNDEAIDAPNSIESRRPTLLTVLCILTWLVSAYTFFSAPFGYFMSSGLDEQELNSSFADIMNEMAEEDPKVARMIEPYLVQIGEFVSRVAQNSGKITLTDMFTALLSAFGAFLMFRLRKMGFWIYLGAKVISLISILIFAGVNFFTIGVVVLSGFISLIVAVLYMINLKHMA